MLLLPIVYVFPGSCSRSDRGGATGVPVPPSRELHVRTRRVRARPGDTARQGESILYYLCTSMQACLLLGGIHRGDWLPSVRAWEKPPSPLPAAADLSPGCVGARHTILLKLRAHHGGYLSMGVWRGISFCEVWCPKFSSSNKTTVTGGLVVGLCPDG